MKEKNVSKQEPIAITGLWLRNLGDHVIVEVEIDGEWHQVIREFCGPVECAFSHIIEPDGIRQAIARGTPV